MQNTIRNIKNISFAAILYESLKKKLNLAWQIPTQCRFFNYTDIFVLKICKILLAKYYPGFRFFQNCTQFYIKTRENFNFLCKMLTPTLIFLLLQLILCVLAQNINFTHTIECKHFQLILYPN